MRVLLLLFIAAVAAAGPGPAKPRMKITLLVLEGCPNSPKLHTNLDAALKHLGLPRNYEVVEMGKLKHGDPRSGYPAPTILLDGRDLFGLPRPAPSDVRSCRLYANGLPGPAQIEAKLRGHTP